MPRPFTGRRRGGQPGNVNRLKHGLYSRRLPRELTALPDPRTGMDLGFEIALARVRLSQLLDQQRGATPEGWLSYERAVLNYLGLISSLVGAAARRRRREPDLLNLLDGLPSSLRSPDRPPAEHSNPIRTSVDGEETGRERPLDGTFEPLFFF